MAGWAGLAASRLLNGRFGHRQSLWPGSVGWWLCAHPPALWSRRGHVNTAWLCSPSCGRQAVTTGARSWRGAQAWGRGGLRLCPFPSAPGTCQATGGPHSTRYEWGSCGVEGWGDGDTVKGRAGYSKEGVFWRESCPPSVGGGRRLCPRQQRSSAHPLHGRHHQG